MLKKIKILVRNKAKTKTKRITSKENAIAKNAIEEKFKNFFIKSIETIITKTCKEYRKRCDINMEKIRLI